MYCIGPKILYKTFRCTTIFSNRKGYKKQDFFYPVKNQLYTQKGFEIYFAEPKKFIPLQLFSKKIPDHGT